MRECGRPPSELWAVYLFAMMMTCLSLFDFLLVACFLHHVAYGLGVGVFFNIWGFHFSGLRGIYPGVRHLS
jgi:hypothetical protein